VPLYEYACLKCGRHSDKIEPVAGPHLKKCPHCGGKVESVITAPAIKFKGSGWYVNDYASKPSGGGDSKKSEGGSDSKDSSSKNSGSKESSSEKSNAKDSPKDSGSKESSSSKESKEKKSSSTKKD
jgi:putative FmdB family regulatory protein